MGNSMCCEKKHEKLPATHTSLYTNLVREQTMEFHDIYEIVGEPLDTGAFSTIWKIQRKDSALGGSSQKQFVKRNKHKRRRKRGREEMSIMDPELTNSLRGPTRYYALKEINVEKVNGRQAMTFMKNEVKVLKSLDHPSIVRLFETFEVESKIGTKSLSIVMELCRGGDLSTRYPYTEQQAAIIIRQVLSAVSYLTRRRLVHRDIKIENIMYQSDDPNDWTVKLIDFGLVLKYAKTVAPIRKKAVGTVYSMSPEALDGEFSRKSDAWSIGVVTYLLLSGDRPFRGKTPQEMTLNIRTQDVVFDSKIWKLRSPECKDFITSLLEKDPELRPDAKTAMRHPWIQAHEGHLQSCATQETLESVRDSLVRYSEKTGDFKRLALNVMAKRLSADEMKSVRDAFSYIDRGNHGYITMDELKQVLRVGNGGAEFTDEEVESVFVKLDINGNGIVTWTEFIAGTLEGQNGMEEHRLADAFDVLDKDDTGYISEENLRSILGKHYNQEYVMELMAEVDINRDHRISFAEFKRVFRVRKHQSIEFHDTEIYDMLRWD